jgi:hypothetical protein
MSIGSDSAHVKPDIFTEAFDNVSQVHTTISCRRQPNDDSPQTLSDNAQMSPMFELPLHPDNVFLVFGIGIVQLSQYLRLFASRNVPEGQLVHSCLIVALTCSLAIL